MNLNSGSFRKAFIPHTCLQQGIVDASKQASGNPRSPRLHVQPSNQTSPKPHTPCPKLARNPKRQRGPKPGKPQNCKLQVLKPLHPRQSPLSPVAYAATPQVEARALLWEKGSRVLGFQRSRALGLQGLHGHQGMGGFKGLQPRPKPQDLAS